MQCKTLIAVCTIFSALLCYGAETKNIDCEKYFSDKKIEKSFVKTLPYRMLKPDKITEGKQYPLVLFLHGAGERGNDNKKQLTNFVWRFVDLMKKHPCFVVAPQCPAGDNWSRYRWPINEKFRMHSNMTDPMIMVLELLKKVENEYPIDKTRIYIVGLSMGGIATWDLLVRRPELFAAAVPIAGAGDVSNAEKIINIPVWAFHGAKDPTIKVGCSRRMVDALKQAGGKPKYTEYPEGWHVIWNDVAKDESLFQWLFSQKKK